MSPNQAFPPVNPSANLEVVENQVPIAESNGTFPIVGIGASAGGFEAFQHFLRQLPVDIGMAFIFVQHLNPQHESHLTELLTRCTTMPILEGMQGVSVRPNHVYVIPRNSNMAIIQSKIHISPREESRVPHLPVDFLFRSLAQDQQSRAIGVILSGSGSDGALGVCEIKAVDGITFAQEEKTAKHPAMPHSAIESGCIDFILPPEEIAKRLAAIGAHPYLASVPTNHQEANSDDQFKKILSIIRTVMGVDFSLYRDTTIKRRILRRMALHTHQSLAEYIQKLESDRNEVETLYHDLLINVTSFFRDPELFKVLQSRIFPELMKDRSPSIPFRVWVAGCSTGQEAYSLAMTLLEFFDDKPLRPSIQIFATDLSDQTSLEKARQGVYPESIESEVSPERLRRFFKREDHVYRIEKTIRDMCVFARQNIIADPPFSQIDLISCRNVLIYLSTPLQKRIMPTFHYALKPTGYLILGSAETIGEHSDLFELVDRSNKIYAKKATARIPVALHFTPEEHRNLSTSSHRRLDQTALSASDFNKEADRILLSRYAPPGVLVNENFDIIHFRGRTSTFLEAPPGEPTTNLLKMAREGLFLALRSALTEAKKNNQPVYRESIRVFPEGMPRDIHLEVIPVKPPGPGEACFLILFHETPLPESDRIQVVFPDHSDPDGENFRENAQLRQELAGTKEYLQSLIEQQDAANEELRSANEEILSSNEELQSTNEELETAKEELQSANEELTTVNEQLQHRNIELAQANNDLTNLLGSINIPVIMVGPDLRIRRFTPPAKKAMNVLPTDIGRPISDLNPAVLVPDLESLITQVIDSVQSIEREVKDKEGRWYGLRIYPYRTSDTKIEGCVIVLVDIDQHKRGEQSLREADRRKDEFLAVLAHELRNPIAPIRQAVEIMRLAQNDAKMITKAREMLDRQVNHLTRIVEDLVDISRIVEKKIELRKEVLPVASIVNSAIEMTRSIIEGYRHRLIVTLPQEPIYVDADPTRLTQVLTNLLNNSAKFTDSGGHIWLTVQRSDDRIRLIGEGTDSGGEVILRVRDDGIGISSEMLPRIFDMFIQGDHSLARTKSGLGVGLTLIRSLVQMHQGTVEAFSAGTGRGSEFVVRLPIVPFEDVSPGTKDLSDSPSDQDQFRRILVVDDNVDQAQSLGIFLQLLGHDVQIAFDGPSALEIASSFVPDMVLTDIGLPEMNGYELAQKIREVPQLRDVLLIAQTGWGQETNRQQSEQAGFDHYFVKPIDPEKLKQIIRTSKRIAKS